MTYRIGIDIGGTFTDFAMIDDATGELFFEKVLTTPADPSLAVLQGLEKILGAHSVSIEAVTAIIHGSTLVTNAVIERKGAKVGMLVTSGFRDVLDIALERRYDLYDLRMALPDPIVRRDCRVEVKERMSESGLVIQPPDFDEVDNAVRTLIRDKGVETLAICFLHSFVSAEHERKVAKYVGERFPQIYVTYSADVLPFMREYERWNTAAVNAYVRPLVDKYLGRLEKGFATLRYRGNFYVMTSSGGTITPEIARLYPVRMLESGPAAGVLMATEVSHRGGVADILSFDMGGTTAKGSIVRGSSPRRKYEIEVARVHEYRAGSGLPVKIPVIDMIEIGSGGGGIAEIDDRGLLRVGPRSAGADPGPASYGRGGKQATLTDANLVLGYYDPSSFLGGAMKLDRDAAEAVIAQCVAVPLRVDLTRAAWGIHETVNEDVARAFRVHASEIGFDYRRSSMVAFGGSGPAHAARIARKLRIPKIIFPRGSGVMSAIGMLVSPLSFQLARSNRVSVQDLTEEAFEAYFASIQAEAEAVLFSDEESVPEITARRFLDMRYKGQGYEIEVEVPPVASQAFAKLPNLFGEAYAAIFSVSYLDEPLEILNWKVDISGPPPRSPAVAKERPGATSARPRGHRRAFFPESGFVDCPIFDRYLLPLGAEVQGPALIEERESTVVLGQGDHAWLDRYGNMIAEIG